MKQMHSGNLVVTGMRLLLFKETLIYSIIARSEAPWRSIRH
ncbi:hypothetical protein [Nitrosomonas sp.]|nr:hypothetical protein [Nitrosomonas sp.]